MQGLFYHRRVDRYAKILEYDPEPMAEPDRTIFILTQKNTAAAMIAEHLNHTGLYSPPDGKRWLGRHIFERLILRAWAVNLEVDIS